MQAPRQDLFQCSTCAKTYTRIDHLARHVRSQNGTSKRRRIRPPLGKPGRVSQACEACSESHLKCEDEKPCRRCQQKDIPCIPIKSAYSFQHHNTPIQGQEQLQLPNLPTPDQTDLSSPRNKAQSMGDTDPALPPHFLLSRSRSQSCVEGDDQPYEEQPRIPSPSIPSQILSFHNPGYDENEAISLTPSSSNIPHGFLDINPFLSGSCTPSGYHFGLKTSLDLSVLDLNFLENFDPQVQFGENHHPTVPPPEFPEASGRHSKAAFQSIWRFVPMSQNHGYAEQENLSLPDEPALLNRPASINIITRLGKGQLSSRERDKILAIIHRQLRSPLLNPISVFPTAPLLDNLIQNFLQSPIGCGSDWIHTASLDFKTCRPELLAAMSAAGAVLTTAHVPLQKMGFAIQEVIRQHHGTLFEANNSAIQDLEQLQSYLILLLLGIWSGNNRKIEIAESFQQPLVTMIRRRGVMNRGWYKPITVQPEDDGKVLQEKWQMWVMQESFKRLALQFLRHNFHISISLQIVPLISYAEVDIPLSAPQSCWDARKATDWKAIVLAEPSLLMGQTPSLSDCLMNMDLLDAARNVCDLQKSCEAILHSMWGMVWEYQQLNKLFRKQPRYWNGGLIMSSRYEEMMKILNNFRIIFPGESTQLWELIAMNLQLSIDEIQAFCCAEDHEETIRLRPSITRWATSDTGRRAVWHAGQIIRSAKDCSASILSEFAGIAVYHASLALLAYSLTINTESTLGDSYPQLCLPSGEKRYICLDEIETADLPIFIELGRGIPGIRGRRTLEEFTPLAERHAMVEVLIGVLRPGILDQAQPSLPLIETLILLMNQCKDTSNSA
ncbi:uncharacterized protein N7483_003389 [Penicillium malachiteum]|uniref:uncharacterized protein n=1 Tax=Penicillium malachiteum TaxID=1324776 RepID=UPI002548B0BA|nr:uncharacterized protein N7483_003389 [Penicillium malachiteum]KAJ5728881.1 hypothetical protein N7483_003389 [Penicillium malachiteum]